MTLGTSYQAGVIPNARVFTSGRRDLAWTAAVREATTAARLLRFAVHQIKGPKYDSKFLLHPGRA
jgi:hypothetical protein